MGGGPALINICSGCHTENVVPLGSLSKTCRSCKTVAASGNFRLLGSNKQESDEPRELPTLLRGKSTEHRELVEQKLSRGDLQVIEKSVSRSDPGLREQALPRSCLAAC